MNKRFLILCVGTITAGFLTFLILFLLNDEKRIFQAGLTSLFVLIGFVITKYPNDKAFFPRINVWRLSFLFLLLVAQYQFSLGDYHVDPKTIPTKLGFAFLIENLIIRFRR